MPSCFETEEGIGESLPMKFFKDKVLLSPPVARAAYSDRTAWIMAELSRIAYIQFEKDLTPFDEALDQGGFVRIATFNKNGTQAFLAKRHDMAVLVFRGTEGVAEDILTDIKCRFVKTKMGHMHTGFHAAYEAVREDIRFEMDQIRTLPIYITGHSLGAALATIATWDLERDNLAACYTFGSPRVGDKNLDFKIKSPVYRVVHAADIVTSVPLMTMKYQHVGDQMYVTQENTLIRSPAFPRQLGRWLMVLFKRARGLLDNHFILGYCEALGLIAEKRNDPNVQSRAGKIEQIGLAGSRPSTKRVG